MTSLPQFAFVVLTFFAVLLSHTNSCFITDCPRGGKRALDLNVQGTRPCMSCGPQESGQCIGPNICCGDFGCFLGTEEASVCEKENESISPCYINGKTCGLRGQGKCVSDGICCDAGACSFNSHCRRVQEKSRVLDILERLLHDKDAD